MYCAYKDITDRLGPPKWWDEEGVPRYCDFAPGEVAGVYADYAALIKIRCQGCGRHLPVAWSLCKLDLLCRVPSHPDAPGVFAKDQLVLPTKDNPGSVGYGDAPAHKEGAASTWLCVGSVETTSVVRIVKFWTRERAEWKRDEALEFNYTEQ